MAHTILELLRLVATALILVMPSIPVLGQAIQCSSDSLTVAPVSRQKEAVQFQRRIESGSFYNVLVQQAGKPKSCHMKLADADISISYIFGGSASLEAEIDPSIEYSEQRLLLSSMNEKKAVALLKEEEVDSFGRSGCGIRWNRPRRESSETQGGVEVVYRGDVCNCQARVVCKGNSIVALVFTSTC